jgi:WhiB family transcriptional regulator, redox-sensing transcriptional regulator
MPCLPLTTPTADRGSAEPPPPAVGGGISPCEFVEVAGRPGSEFLGGGGRECVFGRLGGLVGVRGLYGPCGRVCGCFWWGAGGLDSVRLAALQAGFEPAGLLERFRGLEPGWMRDAACRDSGRVGTSDFFVGRGGGSYEKARRVCRACSVRLECAGYALEDWSLLGMWGGTTYQERNEGRREGWTAGSW